MPEEYKSAVEALRKEFVEACKSVFGDNLVAIINKGSTVKGGFIPGLSDVDLHVYLKDAAFAYNDFLKLELGLSMQEKIDEMIRKYDFGGGPIQVIMLNVSKPRDWSAPLPGTYLVLYGDGCPEEPSTAESMLEQDRESLRNPNYAYGLINSLADKPSESLASYVRRLNPAVTPTFYRVLSVLTRDPLKVWTMTKFEVLEALEQTDNDTADQLAKLGREFYEIARQKERIKTNLQLCKSAIRLGFEIVDIGREMCDK